MNCRNTFQIKLNLDNCMTNKAPRKLLEKPLWTILKLNLTYKCLIRFNQMKNHSG